MNKSLKTNHTPTFSENTQSNKPDDAPVRCAIDTIQTLLFDPQASSKIFKQVLESIIAISESDFGVSFLADISAMKPITLGKENSALHVLYGDNSTDSINLETVNLWIKDKRIPLQSDVFNAPITIQHQPLLRDPSNETSLMILPIVSQDEIRSIFILGKNDGAYSHSIISRLMPLVSAMICVLQSAETVKSDCFKLDRKMAGNRYLNSLLSSSPLAILVVCADQMIVTSNALACSMFCSKNNSITQLTEVNVNSILPNFETLFNLSNQSTHYTGKGPPTGPKLWKDQVAKTIDGKTFSINLTVFRYTYDNQCFTTLQIQDITALHENAKKYQLVSKQLNALTQLIPVGIIKVDTHWNCLYANDKWFEFSGLTAEEEENDQQWLTAIHSNETKIMLEELRQSLQSGSDYQKEVRMNSSSGQTRWAAFNTRVLFNESGSVEGFWGTFTDITERRLNQEKLRHVIEYDGLTGLANRSLFQDRLQQAFYVSEREKSSILVFFLDLDGFKDINDSLGHDIGDMLLQQVAKRLTNVLRRNDTVARFSGDEFVVLLGKGEHYEHAVMVAEKIINTIAQPYTVSGQEIFITISIGIAKGNYTNSSPEEILKQADAALYLAKREGKNNFQQFNSKLDAESKQRLTLLNQLRHALTKDKYSLLFQPVANVATGRIIGFEALLRFTDLEKKLISPIDFIPILEETGMIVDVGKWVIEESCRQVRAWQDNGVFPEDGFLAFNVSPKQLLDSAFADIIEKSCRYHNVDPKHLIMEVTETVIINKPEKVKRILEDVKKIGLRLALDDFGTGYSSLSYLQNYPFDHIKIDKSFVDDLTKDSNDAKITRAIIALAASLGLKVTAEGVETNQSLDFIHNLGADYFQGYLLSRPVAAEKAIKQTPIIRNGGT